MIDFLSRFSPPPKEKKSSGKIDDTDGRPSIKRVTNLYHCDANNIGDLLCGPSQFFFSGTSWKRNLRKPIDPTGAVIFGGGLIFGQVESWANDPARPQTGPSIAWGIGLPLKGKRDGIVSRTVAEFDLFGTRNYDWCDVLEFVPCASCMSPIFDDLPAPKHEVVVFAHQRKVPGLMDVPDEIPLMDNQAHDGRKVAEFISSGETVVTSSYHGVYWAQLLGRRVVCLPFGDKFHAFQHAPIYSSPSSWRKDLKTAHRTDALLDEYRDINRRFFHRATELLEPHR